MKALLLVVLAFVSVPMFGQTFHVSSVEDHIRTKDEPSFASSLHTRRYVGTLDGVKVIAEEAVSLFSGASRLAIGHDYEVTKFKPVPGGALHVKQDPDKRGKTFDAWLTVLSVSEAQ